MERKSDDEVGCRRPTAQWKADSKLSRQGSASVSRLNSSHAASIWALFAYQSQVILQLAVLLRSAVLSVGSSTCRAEFDTAAQPFPFPFLEPRRREKKIGKKK